MKIKCITIAGKKRGSTISLTLDEARDLHESLSEIFGPKREFTLTQEPFKPFIKPFIDPNIPTHFGDRQEAEATFINPNLIGNREPRLGDVSYSDRTSPDHGRGSMLGASVADISSDLSETDGQCAEDIDQENR